MRVGWKGMRMKKETNSEKKKIKETREMKKERVRQREIRKNKRMKGDEKEDFDDERSKKREI